MTPPVASLPEQILQTIVDHCISQLPNEGCGLLALVQNRVMKAYPTSNADHSPRSYTIPPQEHYDALVDAESNGWEIGGVFHSHPNGPAAMSSVDMAGALEPDWVYVVVSLAGDEPEVLITSLG